MQAQGVGIAMQCHAVAVSELIIVFLGGAVEAFVSARHVAQHSATELDI